MLRPHTLLASLVILLATMASAQSGVGVSPPRVRVDAAPGSQLTQVVTVDNPSQSSSLLVEAYLNDVLLEPSGQSVYLDPGVHPNSLAPWISVSELQFDLSPQSMRDVSYTVDIPAEAEDGTYWTILFFESGPSVEEEAGAPQQSIGIQTRVRVGHVIYIDVGELVEDGVIGGVRYTDNGSGEPGDLAITFENTGNSVLRLNGQVEVRTPEGDLVQTLQVPESVSFPGYTSDVTVPVEEDLASGEYVILAVLDYGQPTVVAGEGRIQVP